MPSLEAKVHFFYPRVLHRRSRNYNSISSCGLLQVLVLLLFFGKTLNKLNYFERKITLNIVNYFEKLNYIE